MTGLADRLLLYRLFASTALFGGGAALLLAASGGRLSLTVIVLAGILLVETLFSSVMMIVALRRERLRYSRAFMATQLIVDAVLLLPAVAVSGGTNSPFVVVYVLIILASAFIHSVRFAVTMSLLCCFLVAAASFLEASGQLPGLPVPSREQILRGVLLRDLVYFALFFIFGVLPARLAERLRVADARLDDLQRDYRLVQQLQRLVVEHVPSGIAILDVRGRLLLLNPSGRRILDRIFGLGAGLEWLRFVVVGDRAGKGTSHEYVHTGSDGRDFVLGYAIHPMQSDLLPDAWLVVFQDVTERRELARQLERQRRLAAIGELAASLAHEVRNPLAAISNTAQVLQQSDLQSEKAGQLLTIQQREIARLNELVSSFLEFARPRAPELQPGYPVRTVQQVIEALAQDPDVDPDVFVLESDHDVQAVYDERLLTQILDNLLRNAMQWRDADTPVRVRIGASPDEVEISVVNVGPAVTPDLRERLFEPFVSGRSSGTGLGLSIAWRAAEVMGGRLDLVRSDGKETIFALSLRREGSPGQGREEQ